MQTAPAFAPAPIHRAAEALAQGRVHVEAESTPHVYRVASFTKDGLAYRVDLDRGSCSCPAAQYRGQETCKHLVALTLAVGVNDAG